MIKNVLLFLWQLPQNILGFIFTKLFSETTIHYDRKDYYVHYYSFLSSVSLGNYIMINGYIFDSNVFRHELGHQKQSLYLGWLYLIVIALPSVLFNIYDRIFHRHWIQTKRYNWYYELPWEKWADKLGGVKRYKWK